MRVTIDSAGRLVIPKALRDFLGVTAATEVEITPVGDHLEIAVPDLQVEIDQGPDGFAVLRDVRGEASPLTAEQVRESLERTRR